MIHDDIPGWFDFHGIYGQAVSEAQDGDTLVEVGTWLGRSAAFMAQAIKASGKRLAFFCVDTFLGTPGKGVTYAEKDVYAKWCANMLACGVAEYVKPLVMTSQQAAGFFADRSLAFAFIDADHSEQAVRDDIAAWLPKIKPGGVIAGHDYHEEAVQRAVIRCLPQAMPCPPHGWRHRVDE